MSDNKNGKLVVLSGPSGVGKSTICKEVVARTGAFLSVSNTTRPPGEGEVDGKDYWFISDEEFRKKIDDADLMEYAEVFGNLYGTSQSAKDAALKEGKTVILEIDVQGGEQVKEVYPDAEMIFILPPSQADLVGRLTKRARGEDAETAKKRLNAASREIAAAWQYYDYHVINDDLEEAINETIQILEGKGVKKDDRRTQKH